MELELGLKITRARDDVSSSTDFKVSRDSFSQLWHSRVTGFKKDGIDTEINKNGDRITIRGRKKVEEMVLVKWVKWRKESEIKEFKKVFRIPEIVNLDKIKARFDEEYVNLKVTFPKKVKGITGLMIEEVEEAEPEAEEKTEEKTEPVAEETEEKTEPEEEIEDEDEDEPPNMEEEEEGIVEEEETIVREEDREETEEKESKPKKKKRKELCFPCVAGSTLLMSIIVFIIQLIQSKRK